MKEKANGIHNIVQTKYAHIPKSNILESAVNAANIEKVINVALEYVFLCLLITSALLSLSVKIGMVPEGARKICNLSWTIIGVQPLSL